jgi:hypothetical protein
MSASIFSAAFGVRGGWTLEAAEAVCVAGDRDDQVSYETPSGVVALLGRLVDKSLVTARSFAGGIILEAARLTGVKRLVFTSSAAVCGSNSADTVINDESPSRAESMCAASDANGRSSAA